MRDGLLSPNQVAEDTVEGLKKEDFLILPHPQVLQYIQGKANDYDGWLANIRKLVKK
jgi:hypothetical protein